MREASPARVALAVVVVAALVGVGVVLGRALTGGGTDGRAVAAVLLVLAGGLMGLVRARRGQ
ncbi:hypothetical protein [Phycicoccus sonneratiae]|uniref:Uncharacterized protein n=1 Tax=Phycicoccus sonneratiae TaxID=2807628 RepID=A0ABS2CRU5_9MICO|nr:hypothetical protein [Phycicoccus sonneraticus]MBM6401814.1 hypothetical protein [Phycicoccus sonneraticus]